MPHGRRISSHTEASMCHLPVRVLWCVWSRLSRQTQLEECCQEGRWKRKEGYWEAGDQGEETFSQINEAHWFHKVPWVSCDGGEIFWLQPHDMSMRTRVLLHLW